MSPLDYLKNSDQATPIPSLAELRVRLLADELLPERRRNDMASALASLAKALGRPLETIPADPAVLRSMLAGLNAPMVGLRPGRWRNVLSLVTATLAHLGIIIIQGRIREAPSPAWLRILPLISGGFAPHFHLWRFARYCTKQGIEPSSVGNTVLAAYQRDLETRSLVSDPARCVREAARFWNATSEASSEWPQRRLNVPDNRRSFAPPWEAFPDSLRRDVDNWCDWLGCADPFQERPFRTLRPTSVETRRRQLHAYLGALVCQGVKPEELKDLASAVTPEQAQRALRFFWERAGKQETVHLHQLTGMVIMIAHHWAKLPTPDIDRLRRMATRLRPILPGMTSRNISRLRQLEDPAKLETLLCLPQRLLEITRRSGVPSVHSARQVQTAVAVEILLNVPMRLRNLRCLRIGVDLLRQSSDSISFSIPGDQVKNGVGIQACLPAESSKLIAIYLDRYRALLLGADSDWLFPGISPEGPKSDDGLRTQIQKALADHCGLQFHPHLFRHLAAWLTLREKPDAHGQVQRILGQKSRASTMVFYSGLETQAALQHHDELVDRQRKKSELRKRPGNRQRSRDR